MIGPAAILMVLGIAMGLSQPLLKAVEASADVFQNREAYIATVLNGSHPACLQPLSTQPHIFGYVFEGLFGVSLAFLMVVITLFRSHLFKRPVPGGRLVRSGAKCLQRFHSGHVGDYVTWLVVGASVFGGLLTILIR